MSEEEARAWLAALDNVPRGAIARLERLVALVLSATESQNLIAASTVPHIWSRHVVDSAQLLPLAPEGAWLDVGSGAGFPGLVVAALGDREVHLVEPRRLRAGLLVGLVDAMSLQARVTVHACRVEAAPLLRPKAISARAVAPLEALFGMTEQFGAAEPVWLLPKGRSAREELDVARQSWQGTFELVPSITDPDAAIVRARQVRRRTTSRGARGRT